MAKSVRKSKFRCPQLRNHFIDFDVIRSLELPPEDHPVRKISFQPDVVGGLGKYPVCHCHWKVNFWGSCFPR